jgi:hypothetical protein
MLDGLHHLIQDYVEFDRLVSRFEYKSSRLEYWQLGTDSYCGPLTEVDHR